MVHITTSNEAEWYNVMLPMNRTVWHYMQVSRSSLSQCQFNEPCKCKIINLDHPLNPLKSHFTWSRNQRHQIGDHPTSCTSRRNVSPLGPTTTMPWSSVLLPPTAYFWRNADATLIEHVLFFKVAQNPWPGFVADQPESGNFRTKSDTCVGRYNTWHIYWTPVCILRLKVHEDTACGKLLYILRSRICDPPCETMWNM